ncbi:MAG: Cell shape-determining protein MreC [Fimbriimonadaceae bacterium]|nr:Cell shape-determining protein MreC [Fimbriimonadaceae bacterium]
MSKVATWLWFPFLAALAIGLGRVQNNARNHRRLDPVSRFVQTTVYPTAGLLSSFSRWLSDIGLGITSAPALRQENERLRAIAQAAEQYVARERLWAQDYHALRKLSGFQAPLQRKRIPARPIDYFSLENRMTLSVGKNRGVKPGLAVVTSQGLIGVVQVVDETTCQAILISSPALKVGAMALREPPLVGILRGQGLETMLLDYLPANAKVETGDWVVTSGYSATVPRGIVIGRIVQIEQDPFYGATRARVYPSATVGQAAEVYILL